MDVSNVVELRVHGVSGTPPEDLLDRQLVDLKAGNATAGFYRPTLEAEQHDDFPKGASAPTISGPLLEGYAWGGLTSGAPSRAFWLALLPFSLINVAPRLRPGDPSTPDSPAARLRVRLIWYVCRLLALALTIVLVLLFVGVGMDLVGWQCGAGTGRCGGASPGWLIAPILRQDLGLRVAIGALVPVGALGGLWYLSGRTIKKYERVMPKGTVVLADGATDAPDADEVRLASRWMWRNEPPVRRLRAVHMQTGFGVTLAFGAAPLTPAYRWLGISVAIAIGAYAVVVLLDRSFTGHTQVVRFQLISYATWAALLVVGGIVVARLCRDGTLDPAFAQCDSGGACVPHGGLPGYGNMLVWMLLAELVLLLVLLVVVLIARVHVDARPHLGWTAPPAGMGGMGCWVMALIAVFLAAVFTAGGYLFGAAWLTTGSLRPGLDVVSSMSRTFAVPEAILDAGFAYSIAVAFAVVVLIGFGIFVAVSMAMVNQTSWLIVRGSFETDYGAAGAASSPDVAGRRKAVLRAMFLGRLVDIAGGLIAVLMFFGAALTYCFGTVLALEHWFGIAGPARRLLGLSTPGAENPEPAFFSATSLQGKGAYLAVWTLVLIIVVGGAAFRVRATRKSVGILWDLASFWPRLSHPLAPPCYAERTVPDLITRIRWHTDEDRGVVMAAHSQGTVIGAAAVMQLRTDDALNLAPAKPTLPSVGLLTFGCVLRRLYGRYFPAYFGPATLKAVRDALDRPPGDQRWRNLWRYTDYLGGPVLTGPPPEVQQPWTVGGPADPAASQPGPVKVDAHLCDPGFAIVPGDTEYPLPGRHSDFWKVPEYQQAVLYVASLI